MTTPHETIRQALDLARRQNEVASKHKREEGHRAIARIRDHHADTIKQALSLLETHAVVPREPKHNLIKAMAESQASEDEGTHQSLCDLLDFSGENKVHIVLTAAYKAMIQAAQEAQDE
jgi:hypothetical protein